MCCFDLNISLERVIWQLAKTVAQIFTKIRDTLMAQTNNTVKCFFAAMPPINPEKTIAEKSDKSQSFLPQKACHKLNFYIEQGF